MGKNYYLKDRDILDQALEHSWGKTADAKAKEKAYNREYYQRHKEEILRKARQAGKGVRTEIDTLTSIAKGRGNDRRKINPEAHTGRSMWLHGKGTAYITEDPRVSRDYARNTMKDAKRRADDWANRYKENASKGFRGAANIDLEENRKAYKTYRDEQDAYDVMRKAAVSRSHAEDEVAREKRRRGAERRFDSKLVRDAQNAYSKARGTARKAKDAVDRYVDDALNYAKKLNKDAQLSREIKKHGSKERFVDTAGKIGRKIADHYSDEDLRKAGISPDKIKEVREAGKEYSQLRGSTSSALNEMDKARKQNSPTERLKRDARRITKDARAGIDNAYNQARSGIENAYNQASRTAKNVKNDLETSKRTRQMKNLDTMLKAINKLPADKYEETRELTRKIRSANAQAYNQASKSRRKKRS